MGWSQFDPSLNADRDLNLMCLIPPEESEGSLARLIEYRLESAKRECAQAVFCGNAGQLPGFLDRFDQGLATQPPETTGAGWNYDVPLVFDEIDLPEPKHAGMNFRYRADFGPILPPPRSFVKWSSVDDEPHGTRILRTIRRRAFYGVLRCIGQIRKDY